MKRLFFVSLFVLVFGMVHGQTRSENRWILGTWVGTDNSNNNWEFVLNDNGTGRRAPRNFSYQIYFSINGNLISMFDQDDLHQSSYTVHRINDQRIIFISGSNVIHLTKRN